MLARPPGRGSTRPSLAAADRPIGATQRALPRAAVSFGAGAARALKYSLESGHGRGCRTREGSRSLLARLINPGAAIVSPRAARHGSAIILAPSG